MLDFLPKYFTNRAVVLYLLLLSVVSVIFLKNSLSLEWWIFGIFEVMFFFGLSSGLIIRWFNMSAKGFMKNIFLLGLLIRILWVFFSYFYYNAKTGIPFEFESADALNYHERAIWIKNLFNIGYLLPYYDFLNEGISDTGYPTYLSIIYKFTFDSILITRIIKAFFGASMAVLVFKIAFRNFGDSVARMAAIFVMLMPNLILYTGLHLKETEMVWLCLLFLERADDLIRSAKLNFFKVLITVLIASSLFLFRTVLGVATLFSLFTAIVFSPNIQLKINNKIIVSIWVLIALAFIIGGRISTEVEEVWSEKDNKQQLSLEYRAERVGGNKFATKASAFIFAPAIFVIPLPTIVEIKGHENQILINGGNFVKNIFAFFIILAFLNLLKKKEIRKHILLITYTLGYLIVIALSSFAQSERFHQPVLPVLLIFAAYGISNLKYKHKLAYNTYLFVLFFAIIAWSWFKLAGRGMV